MIAPIENFWQRPGLLFCALLMLVHFASVKLTFFCAVTPDNVVVVWLPNAVLLAALLRFRGQRMLLLAAVTFGSDVLASVGAFSWQEAVPLSAVNVFEVLVTYALLRRSGASLRLQRLEDLVKFVLAGPVTGALLASLMAAFVLQHVAGATTSYLTLVRLWWFGDALGLLIYTPLLLTLTQRAQQHMHLTWLDKALLTTLVLITASFATHHYDGNLDEITVTPTLLLPGAAIIAFRFGVRSTAVFVALVSLSMTMMMTSGFKPFGDMPIQLEVLRAQEFIFTLSLIGVGFSVLVKEMQLRELELEARVRLRTQELELSNRQLATISATDGLTGIPNRRQFDKTLTTEWGRARRNGQQLMLAMIDVDWFKQYNDHYGHQAGDEVLRRVASELTSLVRRSGDFVARYGGEEFAIILQSTSEEHAAAFAEMLCREIAQLRLPHNMSPLKHLTVSVGVAVLRPDGQTSITGFLRAADTALYRAKQRGRNRVELATEVMS
ncbi:diguanylate cyclase domain-containing protein [Pseudomonas sp. DWP3-1-2]|uniref:GGDEF domain-containing protein n=1 Tax=Pseudomonas sp. DWP3-1-2 TaxID=2804645 RepID=UPI003CE8DAA8